MVSRNKQFNNDLLSPFMSPNILLHIKSVFNFNSECILLNFLFDVFVLLKLLLLVSGDWKFRNKQSDKLGHWHSFKKTKIRIIYACLVWIVKVTW